ncbi:MAG: hypothetical protein HQL33_01020 [Alphaproteobacteria bacterium]|nr:hypothetical protein [Alphaproteobacteria bacterium]
MTAGGPIRFTADFLHRHRVFLLGVAALACLIDVTSLVASYLAYPGYVDHGEPSIVTAAWRLLAGHPVYHPFADAERVTNVYGPYAYSVHALMFAVLGPSIASGKAAAAAVGIAFPLLVFWSQRRHGTAAALLGLILASGFMLKAVPASLWNRPDIFLATLVAMAVWAMNGKGSDRARDLAIAVCAGVAVSMKIHAGVYFIPVVLCRVSGRGLRPFIEIGGVAAVVAFAPFLLPVFPLPSYLEWFAHVAGKPTAASAAGRFLYHGLFQIAPALLPFLDGKFRARLRPWPERLYFWSYFGGIVLLIPLAAKPGAGPYYLFPFTAITIDLLLRHAATTLHPRLVQAGAFVLALIVVLPSIPIQKRFQRSLNWDEARRIVADLRGVLERHPGRSIEMGVGTTINGYRLTYGKVLLVFAGHPYHLDSATVGELRGMGIGMAPGTVRRIASCADDLWLVPKGESPFRMHSFYGGQAFDEGFRQAFEATHDRQGSSEFFDFWGCPRGRTSG